MNSIDDDQPSFTVVSPPPRDDGAIELPPRDELADDDPDNDDHVVLSPSDMTDDNDETSAVG